MFRKITNIVLSTIFAVAITTGISYGVWTKSYTIDFGATGDTVKQGIDKLEDNIDAIITYLNLLKSTFVSTTAPTSPDTGQFWLDSNTTPYTQKYYNGSAWVVVGVGLPTNHLSGLTVSHDTDTDHDVSIAAGKARDATDAVDIILASAIVKRFDATWVVGTTNGGACDGDALPTSGTWHVFVIKRVDTGVVDVCGDTSLTPTLPTSYGYKRRIASYRTDGSANILNGDQYGTGNHREFVLDVPIVDISANNPGTSAVTAAVSVPSGIVVKALGRARVNNTASASYPLLWISSLATTDAAPSATATPGTTAYTNVDAAGEFTQFDVFSNTSAQIRYRISASAAENTVYIITDGWEDYL